MNSSEYLYALVKDGVFDNTYHFVYVDAGVDLDEVTAHVVVRTLTNECAVLIEALQRLQKFGATLTGMHRLHGKYTDCLELDLQVMGRKVRRKADKLRQTVLGETTE